MAQTYKVLGQADPAAATPADIYTVPASKAAIVNTVVAANRSGSPVDIRISVAIAGAAESSVQWLLYDFPVPANDAYAATFGITLATTDVLRVEAASQDISFNAFGVEIDV